MSWPLQEALLAAIPTLAPEHVRRHVRAVVGASRPLDALERAVTALGGRLHRVALTPDELLGQGVRRFLPLVLHHPTLGWCAVLAVEGDQFRVAVEEGSDRVGVLMGVQEFCARVGQASDTMLILHHVSQASPLGPSEHAGGHTPWKYLVHLLRDERGALGTALVYAGGVGLLTLTIPVAVQALVNTLGFARMVQPLLVVGAMLSAGLAFAAVLRGLHWLAVEHLQQRLFVRVVLDAAWRLASARRDSAHAPSSTMLNQYYDLFILQKGVATLALDGSALLLQMLVGTVLLGAYHPSLLLFDLVLVVGVVGVVFMRSGRAVSTARAESVAKHRVGAHLQAMADALPGAVGRPAEDHAEDLARTWLLARQAHARHVLRQLGASLTLGVLANAGVLLVGGALVMDGQLTVGQLVAAELVVSAMADGLSKLGKYVEVFYDVLAAAEKVGHLQDVEVDVDGHDGSDGHASEAAHA